jgi:hypothetical protein
MDNDLMVTWNGTLDHDRDEVSLTPWVFTICPGCAGRRRDGTSGSVLTA